jgi:thymidylate synthase
MQSFLKRALRIWNYSFKNSVSTRLPRRGVVETRMRQEVEIGVADKIPTFSTMDHAQLWIFASILSHGEEAWPRGIKTLELYPVAFSLTRPRSRCITNPPRRWSLPLAIGEFCWHVSGSDEIDFISYYAPRWRDYSEDGATIRGSCYGHKLFVQSPESQWDRLTKLLRVDPATRRAMVSFSQLGEVLNAEVKDVACASSLQFMLRAGRLHAFAHMRSNDAVWGLPYDVFLFTMLQELLASQLGVGLGNYYHFAASMHLYERHFALARKIAENDFASSFEMPPVREVGELPKFLAFESCIRSGVPLSELPESRHLNLYWRQLLAVLDWHRTAQRQDSTARANDIIEVSSPYAAMLMNIDHSRGVKHIANTDRV